MSTTTYRVNCRRDDAGWWIITVPQVAGVVSEARRLDQVAAMAIDAIALAENADPATIAVDVQPELDERRSALIANYTRDSQQAAHARDAANRAAAQARADVSTLIGTGLTHREVAQLLGLSPQRVSQLADHRRIA